MFYLKQYKSPSDLINLLKSRGLVIYNDSKAINYIKRIGYYRLSAYFYPLLKNPKSLHSFKESSTFDKALMIYRFDRQLRILIFNQIEKIEIAVRSAIINITSKETNNPFWLTDELCFAEIIPLGVLTRIYQNIKEFSIRKKIASEFGLNIPVFESWMTIITMTRNNCCHHARIWNKTFGLRALTVRRMSHPWINTPVNHQKIYFTLCIIKYFINIIVPNNDMTNKLSDLLIEYPEIDIRAMGFPQNWQDEDLWK